MIAPYDESKEEVRRYEEGLKGKGNGQHIGKSLSMGMIMQKNKAINVEHKQHKLDVIKARKLRLKISETFSYQLVYQSSKELTTISLRSQNKESRSFRTRNNSNTQKQHKGSMQYVKSSALTSLKSEGDMRTIKAFSLKQEESDQSGGMINLFDKFSEQQLQMIEQNQDYYLQKDKLKQLFRRYMIKKRLNNKDDSYQKFMLRSNRRYSNYDFQKFNREEAKGYILKTIGVMKKRRQSFSGANVMTNPLQIKQRKSTMKSNSILPVRYQSLPSFRQFKQKQAEKMARIRQQFYEHAKQNQINDDYYSGIVAFNRANLKSSKKKSISQRNISDSKKSLKMRQRLNLLSETQGQYVQIAQYMRSEMIKAVMSGKLNMDKS